MIDYAEQPERELEGHKGSLGHQEQQCCQCTEHHVTHKYVTRETYSKVLF